MTATETGLRDLFVDLPLALFEALRGAGEQAMRNATSSTPAPKLSSLSLALDGLRDHERAIMGCFGWVSMRSVYSPMERALLIAVRLHCDHGVRYSLSEQAVALAGAIPSG